MRHQSRQVQGIGVVGRAKLVGAEAGIEAELGRLKRDQPSGWLAASMTPLRIGPDGRLYQLRTNPKTGMSIARYSVG